MSENESIDFGHEPNNENDAISFGPNELQSHDNTVISYPVGTGEKIIQNMDIENNKGAYPTYVKKKEESDFFFMNPMVTKRFKCGDLEIYFDFNNGTRVTNFDKEKSYYCRIIEIYSNNTVGVDLLPPSGGTTETSIKWYMPTRIEIFGKEDWEKYLEDAKYGRTGKNDVLKIKPLFVHYFDMTDKKVCVQSAVPTLGDTFAWFPHMVTFRKEHPEIGELHIALLPHHAKILKNQYDEKFIKFITLDDYKEHKDEYYATYFISLFDESYPIHQPVDHRFAGIHETAGWILGNKDLSYEPPLLDLSAKRQIKEPYVCIAVQSTALCKFWLNSFGWLDTVHFLNKIGYRVLCIDKAPVYGLDVFYQAIPNGAEDFTGAKPLQERIDILKYADFFVGLSSGLAWVANACHIPVVMISGFTHPRNEWANPYRIWNSGSVCNSCWNDPRCLFDPNDFTWCPRHHDDPERYACSKTITSTQVINVIKTIPACQKMIEKWQKEHPGEILWDVL